MDVAIDFPAVRLRHPLAGVARRTGLDVPDRGDLTVNCPFHPSRGHHSLYLHLGRPLGRDSYYCFAAGCPANQVDPTTGRAILLDVVQWVRDAEGVGAADALRILDSGQPIQAPSRPELAGRIGSTTTARPSTEPPDLTRTPAERVLAAMGQAWRYYTYGKLHQAGLDYLRRRGIDAAALEAEIGGPVIGRTPYRFGNQLVQRLRAKGFNDDELVDAGLARRLPASQPHEKPTVRDSFYRRFILPIRDHQGRVIGLIGRYDGDADTERTQRYINSPRTLIYDKSRDLYRPSTLSLDSDGQVVVVEGVIDAIAIAAAAAQTGRSSKFAPVCESGVALSAAQIEQIMAIHSRPPVLAGDGDPTGQAAATKWATQLALQGRESVTLTLPPQPDGSKHDPASWLAEHGPSQLTAFTRKGCLEAPTGQVRPRHSGAHVARALTERVESLVGWSESP